MTIRRALDAALRLAFPTRALCMGCGGASGCREDWICPECRKALNESWIGAGKAPEGLDGAAYAYRYHAPASGIVRNLKYSGVYRLVGFMARDMVRAYRMIEPTGADCVTCVPMHPMRLRRRGYNHAERLARDVAAKLQLEYVDALECLRLPHQQARLSGEARRQNLLDSFRAKEPLDGRRILLVDDVCTTGSTAQACAEALRLGGAERVYLLCYCQAGKRE